MSTREFGAVVPFAAPIEVVFDYLGDPRHRPQWQSSLLSVTVSERTEPHVGLRWRETTAVGVRPRMEITHLDPCERWSERGVWHGVTADLTLRFAESSDGCTVRAEGVIHGSGLWRVPTLVAGRLGSSAIRSDLRRAARLLADRHRP